MSKPKLSLGFANEEGELVRFRVKALNSDVAGATVIIKDATGLPLYTLTTDEFGYTSLLSSDFYLDRNGTTKLGNKMSTL